MVYSSHKEILQLKQEFQQSPLILKKLTCYERKTLSVNTLKPTLHMFVCYIIPASCSCTTTVSQYTDPVLPAAGPGRNA